MLLHGVKRTAAGTAPHPLRGLVAAIRAEKNGFDLGHLCAAPFVFLYYINHFFAGQAFIT